VDCEVVWHASQQLCNAESLTGKPCIHQVHEVVNFCVGPEFGRKSAKVGSMTFVHYSICKSCGLWHFSKIYKWCPLRASETLDLSIVAFHLYKTNVYIRTWSWFLEKTLQSNWNFLLSYIHSQCLHPLWLPHFLQFTYVHMCHHAFYYEVPQTGDALEYADSIRRANAKETSRLGHLWFVCMPIN
jgi:hypothetical protein